MQKANIWITVALSIAAAIAWPVLIASGRIFDPPLVTFSVTLTACAFGGWMLLNIMHVRGDWETRCRKCRYILRGISEPRCPECGTPI